MPRLIEILGEIQDVRCSRGKRHCLLHVLVIAVCGILHGYNDFDDIYDYARGNEQWFDDLLGLWSGIPCAKTFNNVFRIIPAESFLEAFLKWVDEIVRVKAGFHIIIDGKAVRAAADKAHNGNVPYIVSAYMADIGISIGQRKVDDKSNEITAIPELLELLEISGCIITIDAIGTQTKIMDMIKKRKAEFVLPLKGNHRGACAEMRDYFEFALTDAELSAVLSNPLHDFSLEYTSLSGEELEFCVRREKTHGRATERIYIKSRNVGWLKDGKFKHVKCAVYAVTNTTVHDNSEKQYVSSVDLPVAELAGFIRRHWQIENNLHWVLDMYFREDLCRVSKDNALENLSLVRKICYNIIKLDTRYDRINKNGNLIKLSLKRKINRYNLYPDEFEELIFSVIPAQYS